MGGGITFDIIDNMAAGNGQILKVNGRAGSWYTYNDGTGMQVPASNGPCDPVPFAVDGGPDGGPPGTTMAMHTTGTGFTSWGAGMAFDLNHPGAAPRQPYDAGAYTGFALWARSSQVPPPTLYVRLLDTETTPVGQQGTCVPPDGGPQCGDSHTVAIATLTTDWQLFVLPFTMFAQEGWGVQVTPKTLDSSKLLSTEFAVENTPDFDFWIGEVSFYTE